MLNVIYSDEVKWKLKLLKEKLALIQSEKKVVKTIGGIISVLDSLGE
ncbi:MAG: hypothetical protein IKW28_00720 [Lachnospiraceae bacterium]|nr:hypothetical protein [Lachnospiraceae bacterium]